MINRLNVRIGSTLALIAACALLSAPAGATAPVPSFWFFGSKLAFERISVNKDDFAVSIHDGALRTFLKRLGASVAWQQGQRYILVTAADHRVISFTLGETRFNAGSLFTQAGFAPYASGGDVYLPLEALARSLYVAPLRDGGDVVLQPQLAFLDVRSEEDRAIVTFRAAVALAPTVRAQRDRFVAEFVGVGSSLQQTRKLNVWGMSEIKVNVTGTARYPKTVVSITHAHNLRHTEVRAGDDTEVQYAFAATAPLPFRPTPHPAPPAPPELPPRATPSPEPAENPTPETTASVTSVDVTPNDSGVTVRLAVSGNASYEWHRLPEPDMRWYIDIKGATLQIPARDESENTESVKSLRVRQSVGEPPTVRVALTLAGAKRVEVTPFAGGLTINVTGEEVSNASRSGAGIIGTGARVYAAPQPSPSLADWKFGANPNSNVAANPGLIIIDPGHGGSDPGASNATTIEKDLNLDVSQRLRTILVARGWTVRMTRTTDVDVYAPNDSAHDELQARCNVANSAGARMFISVHTNGYPGSGPNGTTTYYYKPQDFPLASAIQRRLLSLLGTKDDGVIKNRFYVIAHTTMPAALVETAFLSNPSDAALLRSPAFLQRVAQGIAEGVSDYAGSPAGAQRPGR
ncbi:MAG: N-acetylmuramoyl-L-alanine amidase [Candidatus Eremiobacteraeota bacterium]|nr:N-acetylmuramoyl-L-alanine amidase [Candidatus Eremiobacteraeota bacterium]